MNGVSKDTTDAQAASGTASPPPFVPAEIPRLALPLGGAPMDGEMLLPGDYLFELVTPHPCRAERLVQGLAASGIEQIVIDSPVHASELRETIRVFGRLAVPRVVRQRPLLTWSLARRLSHDALADLRETQQCIELESERAYEARFIAKSIVRKAAKVRAEAAGESDVLRFVCTEHLAEMGWEIVHLHILHRNMRLKGASGADQALCVGVLRWTGPDSCTTEDDPLQFEDLIPVAESPSP